MTNANTADVNETWNEKKAKLKQKFAVLTGSDLLFEKGKRKEMLGKLQVKLGKSQEELHQIMETL